MSTNRRFLAIAFTSVLIGTMATFGMTMLKTHIRRITNRFITTQSRKASLTKLVDLPLEVLVEILVLLEWEDILGVRQTCQRLHDASLARPVWLSLVQWYSATIQPRPFLPEKPLDLCTDRELEYLILKWQSGKAEYALTRPKEQALSLPETYLQSVHLLQGGRWLIFGSRDGSVKYYDLNSLGETPEAVTLVESHFDRDANTTVRVSVDMDLDAEYTTFNLGIMTRRTPPIRGDPDYPNPPRYGRWIEVSRVTSYWDENGQVKGLQAERLAHFREEYMCGCDSFTLGGRYVAYSLYDYRPDTSEGDGKSIAIVDWTSADSTSLTYPRRLIWRRLAEWLALLPDDRLLCCWDHDILLFELSDVPVTTLLPTQRNLPPRQDAQAHLHMTVHAFSQPYLVHDSVRFSILTDEGVKGLIIPRSSSGLQTMDCVDLFSDSIDRGFAGIGYHRAVLCCPSQRVIRTLQYAWPEEHSVSQESIIQTQYWSDIFFDECSTRIVIEGCSTEIEAILDLAAV